MHRLMTKEDRAQAKSFWIKGKAKVQPKGLPLEFYIDETAGKFRLIAFRGTAGRPCAHFWFKTAEKRAAYMAQMIESAKITADYKAKQKPGAVERKLEVGHILYTSWGYDQTNTDFYQVTALKGQTMVMVRKMASSCQETGFMSGKSLPGEGLIGEPIACRVRNGNSIRVNGHAAWIWNGTPKAVSWYA